VAGQYTIKYFHATHPEIWKTLPQLLAYMLIRSVYLSNSVNEVNQDMLLLTIMRKLYCDFEYQIPELEQKFAGSFSLLGSCALILVNKISLIDELGCFFWT
jgi:hypothetical protein